MLLLNVLAEAVEGVTVEPPVDWLTGVPADAEEDDPVEAPVDWLTGVPAVDPLEGALVP